MYRVCVLTSGKYHNVVKGNRYCLSRKMALDLANLFKGSLCDVEIARLVYSQGVFYWTTGPEETRIILDIDKNDHIFYRIIRRKEWKEMYR